MGLTRHFFDEDGRVYFTRTRMPFGLYPFEIDINTGKALSETRLIWMGTGGRWPKSPYIYKIKEFYYLMVAEGGTQYGHMFILPTVRVSGGLLNLVQEILFSLTGTWHYIQSREPGTLTW